MGDKKMKGLFLIFTLLILTDAKSKKKFKGLKRAKNMSEKKFTEKTECIGLTDFLRQTCDKFNTKICTDFGDDEIEKAIEYLKTLNENFDDSMAKSKTEKSKKQKKINLFRNKMIKGFNENSDLDDIFTRGRNRAKNG